MNAESQRYIRFQFWLNDHRQQVLYNEWSTGEIDEADIMLPERLVDLQHWDARSGTILNHLVDAGWQPGTMPYGVDPLEPVPEIPLDHETFCETSGAPFAQGQDLPQEDAKTPPQMPPEPGKTSAEPRPQVGVESTASAPLTEIICILPARPKRSSSRVPAPEPTSGFLSTLCGLCLLVLIAIIGAYHSGSASSSAVSPRTYPKVTDVVPKAASTLPVVRRALPVLTSDTKPVCRALPVEVRRAQLVRLPTR